jgi:propionyl-CoA carboxylase beta chain
MIGDGLVDQSNCTRRRLCRALDMLRNKTVENPWKKHDNIPL